MKVAILNISIGNYFRFWEKFYETSKLNFLPEAEKKYFVFTDKDKSELGNNSDVVYIFQENLGWPFNTMKRFAMFQRIKEQLQDFDYIFFINGNAQFNERLDSSFITPEKNIITVQHPGFYRKSIFEFPYERRSESNACIPIGNGEFYVQGAFIGGKSEAFLKMVEELNKLTEEDIDKNIIAVWHDESFLNKYIIDRDDVQVLGAQYLGFEEFVHPYKAPIILRSKRKNCDLNTFRNLNSRENITLVKAKLLLRNCKEMLLILIGIRKKLYWKDRTGKLINLDINL